MQMNSKSKNRSDFSPAAFISTEKQLQNRPQPQNRWNGCLCRRNNRIIHHDANHKKIRERERVHFMVQSCNISINPSKTYGFIMYKTRVYSFFFFPLLSLDLILNISKNNSNTYAQWGTKAAMIGAGSYWNGAAGCCHDRNIILSFSTDWQFFSGTFSDVSTIRSSHTGDRRGIATFQFDTQFEAEFTWIDAGACLRNRLDRCCFDMQ